jgi:hypothetical protein
VNSTIWLIAVLIGSLLCFSGVGCKKKVAGTAKTPEEAELQLRLSLDPNPQARNIYLDKVMDALHYERYQEALTGLDLLLKEPSLNEEQKRLAKQLIDMLKAKAGIPQ